VTLLEPRSHAPPTLGRRTAPWLEPALALAACTVVSLLVMRRLLEPDVYSDPIVDAGLRPALYTAEAGSASQ
jgi:hypothetical protein